MRKLRWMIRNGFTEWTIADVTLNEGTQLSEESKYGLRKGGSVMMNYQVIVEATNAAKEPEVSVRLESRQGGGMKLTFTEKDVRTEGGNVEPQPWLNPPVVVIK